MMVLWQGFAVIKKKKKRNTKKKFGLNYRFIFVVMESVKIVNLKLKTIPRSFQICQKINKKMIWLIKSSKYKPRNLDLFFFSM